MPRLFFGFVCLWLGVAHMVSRLSKQSLRCCVDSGDALWTSNLTKHTSNFSVRSLGCLNEMYYAPASIAFSPLFFWSGCLDVLELMWGLQPAPAYSLYFFWSGTPVAVCTRLNFLRETWILYRRVAPVSVNSSVHIWLWRRLFIGITPPTAKLQA